MRKASISFVMSVLPHEKPRILMDRFPWCIISECFLKSLEKIHFPLKFYKNNGYCTRSLLLTVSRWILPKMRKVSERRFREEKTQTFCPVTIFLKSGQLRDNVEKYGITRQVADVNRKRCMRVAWWMNKLTDTHSKYIIFNAFKRQQWQHERTLHYYLIHIYTASLAIPKFNIWLLAHAKVYPSHTDVGKVAALYGA
jgi:hypothetical protein